MRNILIFVFILTGFKVIGQPYRPLPLDSISTWGIYFQGYDELEGCTCSSYYLYKTDGDTLIGAYNYTKIRMLGTPGCFCNWKLTTMGVIRQDSVARKVYIIETDSTTEKILYDFTQTAGDTVNSVLWPEGWCPHSIISAVDSVLINGQYHRQLHIQPNGCTVLDIRFIEGIGSTGGLFEKLIDGEMLSTLRCLSYNGNTLYPNSSFVCETTLSTPENDLESNLELILFPNPTNGFQKLTLKTNFSSGKVEIFDAKLIRKMRQEYKLSKEIVIQLDGFSSGIYFVLLTTDNNERAFKKFVVE
jgi:hypothetical protein